MEMGPAWLSRLRIALVLLIVLIGLLILLAAHAGEFSNSFPAAVTHAAGAEVVSSKNNNGTQSVCLLLEPSPDLAQFVDRLPILPVINVSTGHRVVMKAYAIKQKLHRDLPPTTLYGFGTNWRNAQYPGPALQATRNVASYIRWENHIAHKRHFLAVDTSIPIAVPGNGGVPIVTHLHGMELEAVYDGHPQAWFTMSGERGPEFVTQDYRYPNNLLPSMLWYHDHTVGITRLNVVAGLAGPYVVRGSESEETNSLPKGDQEIFLVIQDKQFFANGSINFPSVGNDRSVHPVWCPGYYGDTIVVNGKVWPYLEVFPFKYRLRILNGGSERFLYLQITHHNTYLPFHKIGTDGGYLRTSVKLNHLVVAPGERVDCIVDFTGTQPGDKIVLNNTAGSPYPGGDPLTPDEKIRAVLQFRVVANSKADESSIPKIFSNYTPPTVPSLRKTRFRDFTLTETFNSVGNGTQLLLGNKTWEDPITEIVKLGDTEIWQFLNLIPLVGHPIHIHLVKFHVLNVQPVNVDAFINSACSMELEYGQNSSCYLGPPRSPDHQEIGWKDIVVAWPGNVTRALIKFSSQDGGRFLFDPTGSPGYIWHCHQLSHEDNAMMRPMILVN